MKKSNKEFLQAFEKAWSSQDKEAILSFFSEELSFEDIPLGLKASNKEELLDILDVTFNGVPNFTMNIVEFNEGPGFVTTRWIQSGNMTVKGYGLNLTNYPYEVVTTSVIKRNDKGLVTSVADNWNTGVFYQ